MQAMQSRHHVALVAFAVLCGSASGCCFAPPSGGGGGVAAAPVPLGPAVPVNACDVDDAYRANEIAAGQQYPEGAHVLVSGNVDRVSQNFGTMAISPARCIFAHVALADDQAAAAAALHPGDPFHADCVIGHFVMGAYFENCRLVP